MASFHQQQPSQTPNSKPSFRYLYDNSSNNNNNNNMEQANYFHALDHHPPYIPPFQVAGLAPGSGQEENEHDLRWGFGLEPLRRTPKEQVFLETNLNNNNSSQRSSTVEFLQARSVSTGLGLSLENPRLVSSSYSGLGGLVGEEFELELQRQNAEIDSYIKIQGDRLRQAILEKFHANQLQTISYIEEKVQQKLREKDTELVDINIKNMKLKTRMQQLALEAETWQQQAKYNENMIDTLQHNLQQAYAQSRDSKEGCGDSEIDDTASCYNGRQIKPHAFYKNGNETEESMICKVCGVNEVCMVLLPCKHLCLCKECETKLSLCPLCHSSKYIGMEVYI